MQYPPENPQSYAVSGSSWEDTGRSLGGQPGHTPIQPCSSEPSTVSPMCYEMNYVILLPRTEFSVLRLDVFSAHSMGVNRQAGT